MILKLIYRFFPKAFNAFIDAKLKACDVHGDLELAFILEDRKYYRYVDEFKMPIDRMGQLQEHLIALNACLSGDEIDKLINIFENNLEKLLNTVNGKVRLSAISELGFIVGEIKERRKVLFHPDIFEEITATVYLREDEIGKEYNQKIHDQKKSDFARAKKKGFDPFCLKGLGDYLPLLKATAKEYKAYSQEAEGRVRAFQKMITDLTSEAGSLKAETAGQRNGQP